MLCELEGLSRPEAARRLGIPEGRSPAGWRGPRPGSATAWRRRGVTLPAAALSAILLREARAATVPLSLLESTVEAATLVAAGPSAAVVLSASVASLSEGVIKTMLFAKLKGIALAAGTMTAVVSGAVVLAQPGPKSVPMPTVSTAETTVEARRDSDDRAAALEKKLDRVLDALERLSHSPSPSRDRRDVATSIEERTVGRRPPGVRQPSIRSPWPHPTRHRRLRLPRPFPMLHLPGPSFPRRDTSWACLTHWPMRQDRKVRDFVTAKQPSMVERLQILEKQMGQVQQHLERLDARLKLLDARVGGPEIENISGPTTGAAGALPR